MMHTQTLHHYVWSATPSTSTKGKLLRTVTVVMGAQYVFGKYTRDPASVACKGKSYCLQATTKGSIQVGRIDTKTPPKR